MVLVESDLASLASTIVNPSACVFQIEVVLQKEEVIRVVYLLDDKATVKRS